MVIVHVYRVMGGIQYVNYILFFGINCKNQSQMMAGSRYRDVKSRAKSNDV